MLWVKKNMGLLLSILLLTITVAFFGPIELYFTNYEEFWFGFPIVFLIAAVLSVTGIIFLTVLGLLLKENMRDLYGAVLFVIGLALYIQGNYANIDYGVLDGREIVWGEYLVYAILDSAGWLVLLAGGIILWIRRRNLFCTIQKYGSLFIIIVQMITITVLFFTMNKVVTPKSESYLSEDGMYEVSENENVIIFVLDAFDDAYFQEILKQETAKYQEIFRDFTHFNNTVVGGSRTKIGMPAIITGEHYPGEISYIEYIEEAFNRDKLYTVLQEKNYDVRFYTEPVFIPDGCSELVQNQVLAGHKISSFSGLTGKYFSLTLYKYVPHILKSFFWLYTGDFDQYKEGKLSKEYAIDDAVFFADLEENGLSATQDKNAFRLYHLNGAHPPYRINEHACAVEPEDTSRNSQAKGALYIVEEYISQLKVLGVYDSSTIIIMADHGDENPAHGILLVKERNQEGSFNEVNSPVSYYDLHGEILKEIGEVNNQSFFDIEENISRNRYFYSNITDSAAMKVAEYEIDGDINYSDIKETGNVLEQSLRNDKKYKYGTLLTFGGNNTALEYITHGIVSRDEGDYSWTNDVSCGFEFELEKAPKRDLLVTIDIAQVYAENGAQNVVCYANDVECYKGSFLGETKLRFMIPENVIGEDKKLLLHIELPDAVVPIEINNGKDDMERISLALGSLCIEEMSERRARSQYTFGERGNADQYLLSGWHESEPGGNWASEHAEFLLVAKENCDYEITLNYLLYDSLNHTDVYINGMKIGTLDGSAPVLTLRVSKNLLTEENYQLLEFKTQGVSQTPSNENGDVRIVGIWLSSITVNPAE